MKQYDKITASDTNINDAIDKVLSAFNHRRRNNNTTMLEDFQVLFVSNDLIYVVMIVSYDDYQPDTNQAPPERPKWIGQQSEIQEVHKSPQVIPARKRFISSDHSDE